SLMANMSLPMKSIWPVIVAVWERRPITASELTDFPDPDSPTMASASPFLTSSLRSVTAWTGPASDGKVTFRSATVRMGSDIFIPLCLSTRWRRPLLRDGQCFLAGRTDANDESRASAYPLPGDGAGRSGRRALL